MRIKTIIQLSALAVATAFVWAACAKKNETQLSGNVTPACDTVNMKYAANIQPILQASCTGCHSSGRASGGVALDTYAGVKTHVNNGRLIGAITHATGFVPMPPSGTKLPDCTIEKIRAWIKRGALDN